MEGAQRVRDAGAEAVLLDNAEEEARRIDAMGRVPGILASNGIFTQVCGCTEKLGNRMKLGYDVPALENLPMRPN